MVRRAAVGRAGASGEESRAFHWGEGHEQLAVCQGIWMACWEEKAGHGPQDVQPGTSSPWEAAVTPGGS